MKVMLLSPPFVKEYMRNARCDFVSLSATQWFPILLGYCGCLLEREGHTVRLIDAPAYGLTHEKTEAIFLEEKPDLLVIYTGAKSEDNDIAFVDRLLRRRQCQAVFVGPYFSIHPTETLKKSALVRYGVAGEFERPVAELIEGRPPESIQNLVWKKGSEAIRNAERPYLDTKELDSIPFVSEFFARHLDFRFYRTPSEYHPFVDIMTGRGCAFGQCTFCLWVNTFIKGSVYHRRSIGNVLDEIGYIEANLPWVRSVMLQDDTLTAERAREFSEGKIARAYRLPWSCYARGDLDYDTLLLMKRSGCRNLHVGYESGNDDILRKIRKGLTKERMTQFTIDAKRAGLRIHGDFAIGFPGETLETVRETIAWACALRPATAQFQLMIPFAGTPFYRELYEKGWLKDGAPNYPGLSKETMERLAKRAYRSFYISIPYVLQAVRHPGEHLFNHVRTISRALPAIFWRKWDVR